MINERYQNNISRVTAYPGADIASDLKPLVSDFGFRCKQGLTYNIQYVGRPLAQENLKAELNKLLQESNSSRNAFNETWSTHKTSMKTATKNVLEK